MPSKEGSGSRSGTPRTVDDPQLWLVPRNVVVGKCGSAAIPSGSLSRITDENATL